MPLHNQMAATCILGCCSKYLFAVLLKSHITTHLPDRNSQKPPRFLFEKGCSGSAVQNSWARCAAQRGWRFTGTEVSKFVWPLTWNTILLQPRLRAGSFLQLPLPTVKSQAEVDVLCTHGWFRPQRYGGICNLSGIICSGAAARDFLADVIYFLVWLSTLPQRTL